MVDVTALTSAAAGTRRLSRPRMIAAVTLLVLVGVGLIVLGASALQPHTVKTLSAVVKAPGVPPSTIPQAVYSKANPGSSASVVAIIECAQGAVANVIAVAALVVRRKG